jgi:hypothetical protein
LAGAIQEQQQLARQNEIANQLMNTATPPRAALVTPGISPTTGQANVIGPDVGTAGTAPLAGGIAEMKLRQEFQKNQLAYEAGKQRLAESLAPPAGRLAGIQPQPGDAGAWGGYQVGGQAGQQQPGVASTRGPRGGQAQAQAPVQIGSEPVTDQSQLAGHFDGTYGKGMFSKVMSNIADPNAVHYDDPNNPTMVTVGPADKPIVKVPIGDAQAYVKQQNTIRIRQGLSPFPVPGEDSSIGADQTNPYPATNNLDVYSRPPGSWVKLPNGNIAQVPKP